ncbi:hypothetical protein BDN67DRAFT_985673 [Paxillus ammoniavirescens]|nr:hypothetical protein BDN67DRAFT_985673 [Paxillus ammoniavirescens]
MYYYDHYFPPITNTHVFEPERSPSPSSWSNSHPLTSDKIFELGPDPLDSRPDHQGGEHQKKASPSKVRNRGRGGADQSVGGSGDGTRPTTHQEPSTQMIRQPYQNPMQAFWAAEVFTTMYLKNTSTDARKKSMPVVHWGRARIPGHAPIASFSAAAFRGATVILFLAESRLSDEGSPSATLCPGIGGVKAKCSNCGAIAGAPGDEGSPLATLHPGILEDNLSQWNMVTGKACTSPVKQESTTIPVQQEHKICNERLFMHWYTSQGTNPIMSPPLCHDAEHTDLFLHLYGNSSVQIWMQNKAGGWDTIREGKTHPLLSNHRLWLVNREEPNWITRKTATTYKGKHKSMTS